MTVALKPADFAAQLLGCKAQQLNAIYGSTPLLLLKLDPAAPTMLDALSRGSNRHQAGANQRTAALHVNLNSSNRLFQEADGESLGSFESALAQLSSGTHYVLELTPGGDDHSPLVIGRSEAADIPLMHASVSKNHAHLCLGSDGGVSLSDCSSKNGTFLKGRRLNPDEKVWLQPMDTLTIGAIECMITTAHSLQRLLRALPE